jgi:hypothetical protein
MKLNLSQHVFTSDADPKEVISWIAHYRKTGRLTLTFNQGGLRRPLEWREKSADKSAEPCCSTASSPSPAPS